MVIQWQKSCLEVCAMDPELPAEVIDAVFKAVSPGGLRL